MYLKGFTPQPRKRGKRFAFFANQLQTLQKNMYSQNGFLKNILQNIEKGNHLSTEDLSNIIRWLEILDYKLQVYDCRRKYIRHGNSEYDPVWGTMPVSWIRHFIDMNPFKALDYLRRAQRRITVKSKTDRFLSLVLFETSTPHLDFFTQPDEYIYVSFPKCKVAVFYFLKKKFQDEKKAFHEALYYIEGVSKS